MNVAYNMDCLEAMRKMKDNEFDLAVVDPPYGGGSEADAEKTFNGAIVGRFGGIFQKYISSVSELAVDVHNCRGRFAKYKDNEIRHWDFAPQKEYFDQLFRVSKNQIIWGGNYFDLPPSRCFIVWRKTNIPLEGFTMSPIEYAWASFNENASLFEHSSARTVDSGGFHPTEKPVALYAWILNRYAKPGYKILDTHLGSGSSRIAAYDAGLDFVGYEIDKEYFDKQEQRFAEYTSQVNMFADNVIDEYEQVDDLLGGMNT